MEFFAFASFAVLVLAWLVAPTSRTTLAAPEAEERAAA
jgi:hypothetical protein